MGTPTERCRTVLLSDLPATDDAFGPHDRLAQAIADLVASDQAGSTIALEGGWGSGKSTVVNLLEAKLKDTGTTKVTVFDAWAHQGDPLRRTFLETMMTSLELWILQKDEWTKRRLQLSGRRRLTNETRTPLFTTWGKFLAFSLLLVPVGLALASINLLADAPSWARNTLVALGAALAAAPMAAVAGRVVWVIWHPRARAEPADTWAVLTGQTIATAVIESFETPDPTSVEFHQTFTDLLDHALHEPDRRLVLVLDNLDRVEPVDALAVWSTLQTFLQHSEHKKPLWLDRLWIIIPYDPDGIRRLWDASEAAPEGQKALTPAFLAKTFQVTYEVPPPVLSQWRDFLLTLLKQALPDHDESEFQSVYRLYALHKGLSPAPRDLKLYVNDIGALHQQWQDKLPLCHLASYALIRRDVSNFAEALRTGQGLDVNMLVVDGESIVDSLAALHFNVNVPLARQLLLGDPIENALSTANSESLRTLHSANPEVFWTVLEQLRFTKRLVWRQPSNLVNAARCFQETGVLEGQTRIEAQNIRTELREAVANTGSWPQFDERTSSGLGALLRLIDVDKGLTATILDSISRSPVQEPQQTAGVPPQQWTHSALAVLAELRSLGPLDPESHQVVVPTTAEGWIQICHQTAQDDPDGDLWQYLRPKPETSEISTALAAAVSGGTFSQEHANAIRVTVALPLEHSWGDLVTAIGQSLQAPNTLPATRVALLLDALWRVSPVDSSAEQALSDIGSQGHASHHLYQAASENDPLAFAWCAFIFLRAAPAPQQPPEIGNSHPGYTELTNLLSNPGSRPAVASVFTDLLTRTGELDLLLRMRTQNRTARPFVLSCLKHLADGPALLRLFLPEVFMDNWSWLHDDLDIQEFDALTKRLVTETGLINHVVELRFEVEQATLYASLVRAGASSEAGFTSWVQNALQSVSRDQWAPQLATEGNLLDLLLQLLDAGVEVPLDLDYMDAVADHAKATAAGVSIPSRLAETWPKLLTPLRAQRRKTLRRKIYDAAVAAPNIHDSFFRLYGDEMADPNIMRQDRQAPYRLFVPVLQARNIAGLTWLKRVLAGLSPLEDQPFASDTILDFKDRVQQALGEDQGGEPDAVIQQIAQILNIKPSTDEEPTEAR